MTKFRRRFLCLILVVLFVIANCSLVYADGEENFEDSESDLFSLGEHYEEILVRGMDETVADYGDAVGYETTSYDCTSFVPYRDSMHHTMKVTSASGTTIGYCMQPYMRGPNEDSFTDYNYVEGLNQSNIFNGLSEVEVNKWRTVYVVAGKYGYGGEMSDPNNPGTYNEHHGGSYGTYIIKGDNGPKVVQGLMVGGKVYEMTRGEAMALTQVLVHYICNRDSDNTITDFVGKTYPHQTSAAFAHLKAYADNSAKQYDYAKDMKKVACSYDAYKPTQLTQQWKWLYYDYEDGKWQEYNGESLTARNIGPDGNVKLKVSYYSKNMCNKLVVNTADKITVVKHAYEPYVIKTISDKEDYYDYFTVINYGSIPITVDYQEITANKELIKHELLDKMEYEADVFSQEAIITIDGNALMESPKELNLTVATSEGAAVAPCYDESRDRYCARMFSSPNVQDCLMIASIIRTFSDASVTVECIPTGKMRLIKSSSDEEITSENSCYDKTGAIYNVYSVKSGQDQSKVNLVATFQTDVAGDGRVIFSKYRQNQSVDVVEAPVILDNLPLGWYMICEEKAPANGSYLLDEKKYYANITKNNFKEIMLIESSDRPVADPIPFEIVKECAEGENVGAATLEGAEFTVWYYKGYYDSYDEIEKLGIEPARTWIFKTAISKTTNNATCIIHKDLLLEGSSEPYVNDAGDMILPLGTIVVSETKAPEGFKLEGAQYYVVDTITGERTSIDNPYVSKVKLEQGTIRLSVGNKLLVSEQPIRGDLELIKKDKHTSKPMAGIPFLITSKTTGEAHIIVTDENGVASTASNIMLHSNNTNGNDEYVEGATLEPTGVWFSGNSSDIVVDDGKGALPYDQYIVKELSCDSNKDYKLAPEFEIIIAEDNKILEYGVVYNTHEPEIKTEVFDIDGDKIITKEGKISVTDRVSYKYLETGKEYKLIGEIVYKGNGQNVEIDGKQIYTEVEFVADKDSGIVDVPFEFKLPECKDVELVVYESLYDKATGEIIAYHKELNCPEQTFLIKIPEVKGEMITPAEDIIPNMQSHTQPQTGDSINVWLICSVMILVGVCTGVVLYKYRKS